MVGKVLHSLVRNSLYHWSLLSANDEVKFAKTTEFLGEALESLSDEAELLGLRVSWIKTNAHAFGEILDPMIESIPVSGENIENTDTFTHLGSVIGPPTSCELAVSQRMGCA